LAGHRELIALYGSPLGTLCGELSKRSSEADIGSSRLVRQIHLWVEGQFKQMGVCRNASDLALELLAICEGTALVANVLQDLEMLSTMTRRINHWIDAQ
jgi:hypothetical protein